MRRSFKALLWIGGGELLILLLVVGGSVYRLEQAVGELHAVLPHDGYPDQARLERQLLKAAESTSFGSALLAVTAILLGLICHRELARRDQAQRAALVGEDAYRHWIKHHKDRDAAPAVKNVETMQRLKADVLVSDIEMVDEDGYTLIRRVRALGTKRGGMH